MNVKTKIAIGAGGVLALAGAIWWSPPSTVHEEDTGVTMASETPQSQIVVNEPTQKVEMPQRSQMQPGTASATRRETLASSTTTPAQPEPAAAAPYASDAPRARLPQSSANHTQAVRPARPVRSARQIVTQAQQNGMRIPVALMAAGFDQTPLSPQQQTVLNAMEEEFLAMIEEEASMNPVPANADLNGQEGPSIPRDRWEEARELIDNRFRLFFGDEAYNQMVLESAMQAASK